MKKPGKTKTAASCLGLTRRGFLRSTVALATVVQLRQAAFALGVSQGAEVCKLQAEQEQGPFYVANEHVRSNIVEGKVGLPLSLRLTLLDARSCKPIENAAVDIWHCDPAGVYSGFTKQGGGFGGPGGPPTDGGPDRGPGGPPPDGFGGPTPGSGKDGGRPHFHAMPPTDQLTFLRGIQVSGKDGTVGFDTVFPGFYMGRVNHIHFKVRLGGEVAGGHYAAGHTSYTGQIFFPEELAAELMRREPYSLHTIHRTTLSEDHIYGEQHGEASIARVSPSGTRGGYRAELIAVVDPGATSGDSD